MKRDFHTAASKVSGNIVVNLRPHVRFLVSYAGGKPQATRKVLLKDGRLGTFSVNHKKVWSSMLVLLNCVHN